MSHANTMQLYLQQPLQYTNLVDRSFSTCAEAFDNLLHLFDTLPIGSDGCLVCEAVMTDELCLVTHKESAYSSVNEETPMAREIPSGSYVFQQLQFPPTSGKLLLPQLNRFALSLNYSGSQSHTLFVRLYKEKQFEIAIQFIAPIQTKAE